MTDRRRNTLILLIVAGLVAASLAAIIVEKTRLGLELKGGVELVYEAKPTAQSQVTPEALERAINIMRTRVDQLGLAQPEIQRSGPKEIVVALPEVHNVHQAEAEVGKTAQLQFYDWETNVIGANGQPAPTEGTVTGDSTSSGPGGVTAGLNQYDAVLRAAKRPAELRKTDTTWTAGCTPQQLNGCIYGSWYLLDTAHEAVVSGPEESEADLYNNTSYLKYKAKGEKLKAVRVNPGTVLVRAHPVETAAGKVSNTLLCMYSFRSGPC